MDALQWRGIDWQGEPISQFSRQNVMLKNCQTNASAKVRHITRYTSPRRTECNAGRRSHARKNQGSENMTDLAQQRFPAKREGR